MEGRLSTEQRGLTAEHGWIRATTALLCAGEEQKRRNGKERR
jgi:hypothetical protein